MFNSIIGSRGRRPAALISNCTGSFPAAKLPVMGVNHFTNGSQRTSGIYSPKMTSFLLVINAAEPPGGVEQKRGVENIVVVIRWWRSGAARRRRR